MLILPFRVYQDQGGDTETPGGGGGDSAVADTPIDAGLETGTPAPDAGDTDTGTPSPEGGDTAGDGDPTYLLDSMPERGTPEYVQKFNEMSMEDRLKVEQEIMEGHEQKIKEGGDEKPPEKKEEPDKTGKKPEDTGTKPDQTGKKKPDDDLG